MLRKHRSLVRVKFLLILGLLAQSFACGADSGPQNTGDDSVSDPELRNDPNMIADTELPTDDGPGPEAEEDHSVKVGPGVYTPYKVVSVDYGLNAGYGQDTYPDLIMGLPLGADESVPQTKVLTLGYRGVIVLDMGKAFQDIEGPELFVYENAFRNNSNGKIFAEPGKVSVSLDGKDWTEFPCEPVKGTELETWGFCAGLAPTKRYEGKPEDFNPLDQGGDHFDLKEIGVKKFRYVRIQDQALSAPPADSGQTSWGFDLHAVVARDVAQGENP